jgi:RNA polymerase sigma-70 factor (ECF subfamily)
VSRDAASFDAIIRPHLTRLYRLAFRFTGHVADAEDLVQDVLIKVYRRRAELASVASLGPWLGRVLHNQFVDDARRYARRRGTLSIDDPAHEAAVGAALYDAAGGPEACGVPQLDIRRLTAALAKLSVEHRTVLLMHDCEGYKLEEIQSITGVALGTVKSRLHRARARLRELLGAHGTF